MTATKFPPPTKDSERLVKENMGLVLKLARQYSQNCSIPFDDLVQAGSIGLIRACRSFDPAQGYSISTFCVKWIRGAILHTIRDHAFLISFPTEFREKGPQVRRLAREGRNAAEIAAQSGLSEARVVELLQAMSTAISLDHTLEVRMGREAEIHECQLGPSLDVLERALERLSPVDQELLNYCLSAREAFPSRSLAAFRQAAKALLRGRPIPVASIEARVEWEAAAQRELAAARRRREVRQDMAEREAQAQAAAMQLGLFELPEVPATPAPTASASTSAAARGAGRKPGLRPLRRPAAQPRA